MEKEKGDGHVSYCTKQTCPSPFSFQQRGGTFEDKTTRKPHVLAKDGQRYTVELRYQIDPDSHGVREPPAAFKDELLWRGSLTTAPLEFEVSAK